MSAGASAGDLQQPQTYVQQWLHLAATQQKLYKNVMHFKLSFNGCYQ